MLLLHHVPAPIPEPFMTKPLLAAALLAASVALSACAVAPSGPMSASSAQRLASVRVDPVQAGRLINSYRASQGLPPLRLDPKLTAMAQYQSNAMAAANSLSHDVGGSFTSRIQQARFNTGRAAENLGAGYFSTEEAVAGWRSSSGHDANLRLPDVTRYGIALTKSPNSSYGAWWTLVVAAGS